MTNLYDALDVCLKALEQGRDIDFVLALYPDMAEELRPILEASRQARFLSEITIPVGVQRRGRARLLRRADEMRRLKRPSTKQFIPLVLRLAVVLSLAAVFFLSSTGLVSASSGSLPGDQLYPVKRTWEGVRLFFTFNSESRDILQSEYDQERLDEIDGLLAKDRAMAVTFSGLVTKQSGNSWLVSGIPVLVTSSTQLSANLVDGAPVNVIGSTRIDGQVEAQEIQLLQAGVSLPPLEPSNNNNTENEKESEGGKTVTPSISPTASPQAVKPRQDAGGKTFQTFEFHGVVNSILDSTWTINGQPVVVEGAQIHGTILPGSVVKFQGYYGADGRFVVTSIENQPNGGSDSSNKNNGDNKNGGNNNGSGSGDSGGNPEGGGTGEPGTGDAGGH